MLVKAVLLLRDTVKCTSEVPAVERSTTYVHVRAYFRLGLEKLSITSGSLLLLIIWGRGNNTKVKNVFTNVRQPSRLSVRLCVCRSSPGWSRCAWGTFVNYEAVLTPVLHRGQYFTGLLVDLIKLIETCRDARGSHPLDISAVNAANDGSVYAIDAFFTAGFLDRGSI